MADITMCSGTGCPMKPDCYRNSAKENEFRQSWFCEVPVKFTLVALTTGEPVYRPNCQYFTTNK